MRFGSFSVKTLRFRSRALLCRMTSADQRVGDFREVVRVVCEVFAMVASTNMRRRAGVHTTTPAQSGMFHELAKNAGVELFPWFPVLPRVEAICCRFAS